MHIITYPLTVAEEISILFAVIGEQILTKVSIKARRAILTTSRVILRFFIIIPAGTHITTVNQFSNLLAGVIVSAKNATQPFRITIPMMIHREHRIVLEFDADTGASAHKAFG
jgi:hypothetical protein